MKELRQPALLCLRLKIPKASAFNSQSTIRHDRSAPSPQDASGFGSSGGIIAALWKAAKHPRWASVLTAEMTVKFKTAAAPGRR
jgi:hypothetical protein